MRNNVITIVRRLSSIGRLLSTPKPPADSIPTSVTERSLFSVFFQNTFVVFVLNQLAKVGIFQRYNKNKDVEMDT